MTGTPKQPPDALGQPYLLRSLPVAVGGKTLWFKVSSNIAVLLLPSMGSVKSTVNVLLFL